VLIILYVCIVLKKILNILLAWVLVFATSVGYAGVPFYTMICKLDGHVKKAIVKTHASCSHNHVEEMIQISKVAKKSCCRDTEMTCVNEQDDEQNCCDFESELLKIETPATTKDEQDQDNVILLPVAYLVSSIQFQSGYKIYEEEPIGPYPVNLIQCHRTFTRVFRI
jgi:hypothetical protein